MDCRPPGSSSLGFPRQECWNELLLPPSGDLPDTGIKPTSPTFAGEFFTTEPPGKPHCYYRLVNCNALEKEMATHSSILAWRIPGTGKPGGLLSVGSHRVGHDWSDLAVALANCNVEHFGHLSKIYKLQSWAQVLWRQVQSFIWPYFSLQTTFPWL